MNPWICASLITFAGAMGGVVNALLTDNGFILPRKVRHILCPGFLSNIFIGMFSAFASWAFYGSGAGIDLSDISPRTGISLRFSALAGAFLVGVAGSRWITNEVDKKLLKESVKEATKKHLSPKDCQELVNQPARKILDTIEHSTSETVN